MLGVTWVREGSQSLQQPSLCLQSRGALVQLLSLRLLQVGTSTALLWACSQHRGEAESSGTGVGGEGRERGQISLELHTPHSTAFGFTSPPLPSPPGSWDPHGPVPAENKCPSSPSWGAARHEGGEQGLGAVRERSSPKAPTMVQERPPPSLLQQSLGHEGAKAPSLHPNDVHTGPLFLQPPFAGAGVAGSDVVP